MDNKGMMMNPEVNTGGYNQAGNMAPLQHVVVQSPTHTQFIQAPVTWKWCTMVTAVISCCLCALCGMPAVVAALMAYSDHKVKDHPRSTTKLNFALGCGITGIIVGAIFIIGCIAGYASLIALLMKNY